MENRKSIQYVDPEVTKRKFEKEIREFKRLEQEYRNKGVISYKTTPNSVSLLFGIPHLKPQPIAFAVNIEYTNWDVEPPSIKFIDPFTDRVLQREEISIDFYQVKANTQIIMLPNGKLSVPNLLQGSNNITPFFCIPGVKEYHDHAAHSGDSWMLYRKQGEGKLCVLIDQLYSHSISQSSTYAVNLQVNASVTGINTDINKLKS